MEQLELFFAEPESAPTEVTLASLWHDKAPIWSRCWGVADLRGVLGLEVSRRMRTSLGYYLPESRKIRISDVLLEAPPAILEEILCHEAAHAAVEILHGNGVRAHGREWKDLMRQVGLEPRARVPGEELGGAAQRAARRRWVWDHRCRKCGAHRLGGRPVRQWRCLRCREAGRSGRLEIKRRARDPG